MDVRNSSQDSFHCFAYEPQRKTGIQIPHKYRRKTTNKLPYFLLACRRVQKPEETGCLDRKFLLQGLLTAPHIKRTHLRKFKTPVRVPIYPVSI